MTFAFIEQHAFSWPANVMCRMLGVSRSGRHDCCDRAPSVRTMTNLALPGDVRRLQARHRGAIRIAEDHALFRLPYHDAAHRRNLVGRLRPAGGGPSVQP